MPEKKRNVPLAEQLQLGDDELVLDEENDGIKPSPVGYGEDELIMGDIGQKKIDNSLRTATNAGNPREL